MPLFTFTGFSQSSDELSGQLGLVERVGNFYTVRLTVLDVGIWNINISSLQSYSIKAIGNFLKSISYYLLLKCNLQMTKRQKHTMKVYIL